jgi:hypothetical protein
MSHKNHTVGPLVALNCPQNAVIEIEAFFRKSGRVAVALTVHQILDEQIAKRFA